MLSGVVGHEKVKKVLASSFVGNRVGHAYIFEGPKGVGRLTAAKAFSKLLLCENPQDSNACGACKSCKMCESGNHPDMVVVTNQLYDQSKKSTDVLVDTIRNMKKDIFIKPYLSGRKIYIIPKADTMNMYAQNSLLKVLEEPPEYCTIILIAENTNMFLPTIISRAVPVKFFPVSVQEVCDYIRKAYPEKADSLSAIAAMSGGCIGRAKLLCESQDMLGIRTKLISLIDALCETKKSSIYDLMVFLKQNKDETRLVWDIMQSLFCDLMYIKKTESAEKITNSDKTAELEKIAGRIYADTPAKLLEVLIKYSDYILKNISYAQIAQCMSLEFWEAIHDRSYRCEI